MAEEAPAAAEPASESSEAPKAVPVQKSGGGFKLRLKLHSQPPAPVKPASTTEEEEDDEDEDEEEDEEESDDEEEDQLASSSSDSEDQADRASSLSALSSRPNASSLAHPSPSRSLLGTARAPRVQYNEDYHFDDDDDDGSRLSSVPPSDDGQPSQDPSLLAAPNPDAVEDAPEGTSDIDPIERHPATTSTVDPAPGPALASTSTKPVTLAKKRKKAVGTGRGKGWRAGITGTGAAAQMPNPSADGLLPPPAKKSRKGKKGGRGSAAHNAGTSQFAFEDASLALYVPPPPIPRIAHDPSLGPPVPPPVTGVRPFPLGPLPKAQSGFLPAQTLEKKAPRTRAWKKVLREVVTVGGYPCRMWTFAGDAHSDYAFAKQTQLASQAAGLGTPGTGPNALYFPPPPPGSVPFGSPYDLSMAPPPPPGSAPMMHLPPPPTFAPPPHLPQPQLHALPPPPPPHEGSSNPALGGPPLPASFRLAEDAPARSTPEKPTSKGAKGKKTPASASASKVEGQSPGNGQAGSAVASPVP